ncbi:MAG: PDZ domain-containing protein [Myxococcota bacterium]
MRPLPLVWALLAGLVGSAVSVLGFWALSAPEPGPPKPSAAALSLSREVADLRRDLAAQHRRALEIEQRLEALETASRALLAPPRAEPGPVGAPAESPRAGAPQPGRPWFDEAALASAGLDRDEIQELRAPFEETELARLFLEDRARREGWAGTERYREALRQLRERAAQVRERLGDDRYDWYRYATGRPNRIRVRDVLAHGPAADAGLEVGDLIVRYDDQRVFEPRELRRAIANGPADEQVPLDILRGREELRLWLPRGPLGIQLQAERVRPRGEAGTSLRLVPAARSARSLA